MNCIMPGPTIALRESIERLTYECPKHEYVKDCPFSKLAGLTPASRTTWLATLSRGQLLALFDLTRECGCPANPERVEANHPFPCEPDGKW